MANPLTVQVTKGSNGFVCRWVQNQPPYTEIIQIYPNLNQLIQYLKEILGDPIP